MHATLIDALESHVATRGDTVFTRHLVGSGSEELTFRQFSALALTYGAHYRAAGIGKGDVVLIFLHASPHVLPAFVGAMMIGAVPSLMPLPSAKQHPSVYWPSHQKLLDRIQPRLLLTDRDHEAQMVDHGMADGRTILAIEDLRDDIAPVAPVEASGADIALLQHSSGTTSLKKGVALSHDAILKQAASYAARLGATADDAIVSWLPIYHDMGLIACSIVPLVLGQTVTILDPFQWVGRPATLFDAIQRYDGKFVWMPNFAFEHMTRAVPADYRGDLSGARAFIDCSEPCKTDTFDRFADRFAGIGVRRDALHICYAMAETVFAVTQTTPGSDVGSLILDRDAIQERRVATDAGTEGTSFTVLSNGAAIDGITIDVRDDSDRSLGDDAIGEIVVSGDFLFTGYFNDPATTAERLQDGWYRTRDMGFLRDGELYVLGRKDDLLIVSGRNLHAHEVEDIVGAVPGLKPGRAVAFGVFNAVNASEDLVIVAERDEDEAVDADEIGRLVREAVFDRTNIDVKDLSVVAPGWLIKTTSGKISRERNKARYLEGVEPEATDAAEVGASDTDAFGEIAAIIARTFRCPVNRISRDTVATDISGWDSLAHSTLIIEVERDLKIRFPDDEIFSFENVGALVDRATQLRGEGGEAPDRILAEDENFSILAMGEPSDAPDLVICAGAALKFGGHDMMDFASTLRGTPGENSRRLFVTDRGKHWFTDSFDEIAAALNVAAPGPKVLIGNSMGGYGVLKLGPLLDNVISILSFAPQPAPPFKIAQSLDRGGEEWYVQPTPGIPTSIIYGEIEDERSKEWIGKTFVGDPAHQMVFLANCGHNVVVYLNKKQLLAKCLISALDPATMNANVAEIVASVEPSEAELITRIDHIRPSRALRALKYLKEQYPDTKMTEASINARRENRKVARERRRARKLELGNGGRDRD